MYDGPRYGISMSYIPLAGNAAPGGGGLEPIKTVRTFFPETWIWDLVEIG